MPVTRRLLAFTLVGALAGPLAAGAQTPPPPTAADSMPPAPADSAPPMTPSHHGHRHRKSFIHALRAVHLTPAQQQQIATFRDQERKANVNADSAAKKANAVKMRQQIMSILTPDQKTQLSTEMHRSGTQVPNAAPLPSPLISPGSK